MIALLILLIAMSACSSENTPDASVARDAAGADAMAEPDAHEPEDPDATTAPDASLEGYKEVYVRLDGVPTSSVVVLQGGTEDRVLTDALGRALLHFDDTLEGEHWIFASHPEARIRGELIDRNHEGPVIIHLTRYDRSDDETYRFQDPGEPDRSPTTAQCGHCHQTINAAWIASPHKQSASNPHLWDLYSGPGGVLERLQGTGFGACADCHAPGIDGVLGGRDLMEASGFAYDYGVHCDVCHRVERVELTSPQPGVAGRLRLMRPIEPAPVSLGAGGRLPLTFGPSHDAANPRMGNVQRDHFRSGELCAGCHQQDQAALIPGTMIDPARWPDGKIPVHSTYEEWRRGPFGGAVPCQECHMPPDPLVINGADLQFFPLASIGVQGGFLRAPGSVRAHSWIGPRAAGSRMLELAAAVFIRKTSSGGRVTAEVTVKNLGCGHALPTGEPMRQVILRVDSSCGAPLGGDVIPDFGGYVAKKDRGEDWTTWPEAQVGDRIRVVRRPGGYHDYEGFGAFGATFTAIEKGMPIEQYAGTSSVTAKLGDTITAEPPLAAGDVAYLVRGEALAGAPGFAFARVLTDDTGARAVPHFKAIDVASDNRILPQKSWTSTHVFAADCADPIITATLIHRPHPFGAWPANDQLMTEVRR